MTVSRALALLACAVSPLAAQTKSQFVITKGNDTVAVELFSRDAKTLTSEIYQTNGPRTQYTIDLKPDSTVSHVELTRVTRANQTMGMSVFFLDGSMKAQVTAGGETQQFDVPVKNATPFLAVSFALLEQIVRSSHLSVGKSVTYTAVRLGVADTTTLTLTRFHADSVLFAMPDVQMKVALSSAGEVVGGTHLAQGWTVTRKTVK